MLKRLGRSRAIQTTVGYLAVGYLRLVEATTRFVAEPAGFPERIRADLPVIAAMWHGSIS